MNGERKERRAYDRGHTLNNQTCGTWQVASKMTALPFINRIFDVGYAKAGAPASIYL